MHKIRARNIHDVIDLMSSMVNQCIVRGDRMGFFCALYRMVTEVVRDKCNQGFFADNDRMRELDVHFANRYFIALAAYKRREPLTASWKAAFDATKNHDMMIMQHLLLGMNAHINLDLGISTAEVSGGVLTPSLKKDFDALNDILTALSARVQQNIVQVSPMIRKFEPVYKYVDDLFVRVGITNARTRAWGFAEELVSIPYEQWESHIAERDQQVAQLAHQITQPPVALRPMLKLVAQEETKDIHGIVSILGENKRHTPMMFNIETVREMARKRGIDW